MLRNKYVTAGLGGLLILVVIYNVSFFSKRSKGDKLSATPRSVAANSPARPATRATSPITADYIPKWQRDPFWYHRSTKPATHAASSSRKTTGPQNHGIKLEATMMKDGKGYALMSGQIVGIGERIQGYTIQEIGNTFVRIKSAAGTKTLSLTDDTSVKE